MRKTYVLDTNVLMCDPNAIYSFEENDIVIPLVVLEELDRNKNRPDEPGRNARHISRLLDDLRKRGNLYEGVQLRTGGNLRISMLKPDSALLDMKNDKVDNLIILYMLELKKQGIEAKLVSKDINVRLKCDAVDVRCEDYIKMRVGSDPKKFYRGVEVVSISRSDLNKLHTAKHLPKMKDVQLYENQIVVLKPDDGSSGSAIARVQDDVLVPVRTVESVCGLRPRNKEQNFSLDLLLDPEIKLLTLVGPSGTGKTLLAIAAALEQIKGGFGGSTSGQYERLIITRPITPVGKDIGYLPGTLQEKMDPWVAPIRDNLNFLLNNKKTSNKRRKGNVSNEPYLDIMQERGIIEIEAISFIRGRSIPNSFIIIDEAQNLSTHELKTIITRVGDGTKIILTGDIEQIDNANVDVFNNGLTYAIEKFKEHAIAGHVTLIKGERSDLATLASQIL